jgi:hypothetical protein
MILALNKDSQIMNNSQRSYLKMLEQVRDAMDAYRAIWSDNTGCVSQKHTIDAAIEGMMQSGLVQMQTFSLADKQEARMALTAILKRVTDIMKASAVITADETLRTDARLAIRSLTRLSDVALLNAAKRIADLAGNRSTQLASYGITAQLMADCADKTASFSSIIGAIATNRTSRAVHRAAFEAFREDGVAACRQLDTLMATFRNTAPAFVAQYQECRKVQQSPKGKRALQVQVMDAANTPITQAALYIPTLRLKRRSGRQGRAYFLHLPPGTYALCAAAEGYAAKEVTVSVNARERTVVTIALHPEHMLPQQHMVA